MGLIIIWSTYDYMMNWSVKRWSTVVSTIVIVIWLCVLSVYAYDNFDLDCKVWRMMMLMVKLWLVT